MSKTGPRNKEKYEEVIGLRVNDGLFPQEISKISGVPYGTVTKWLHPYPLTKEDLANILAKSRERIPARQKISDQERKRRKIVNSAKWYESHKEDQFRFVKDRRKRMYAWLASIKLNKKCLLCEETHPACLEFHHRNPLEKDREIPIMVGRGVGKEKILQEISKCDLLCSNCHKKLHWNERHQGSRSLAEEAIVS